MPSISVGVVLALAVSVGVLAQNEQASLPKCLEDASPVNVDFKDVTIAKVLSFLGASCGIEIGVENIEGTEAARTVPNVRFNQTKPAEIFVFLVRTSHLKYAVLDDKTIVVTTQ